MKASRKSGVAGTIPFNNAAERALRGLALGRKSWLFAGLERGAERAAIMYTLIQTAKLNEIDPQAWLADTLSKIAEMPQTRLGKLLPWNWMSDRRPRTAAQLRPSAEGYDSWGVTKGGKNGPARPNATTPVGQAVDEWPLFAHLRSLGDVLNRRRPCEKAMFKSLCGSGPEARLRLLAG